MTSCTFFGRLPVLSIDNAQRKRYIIASTITIGEEEPVELKLALHVFLDVPIQRGTLIEVVDIPFANNGEQHITLGADTRNIEQLGDGCPSGTYPIHSHSPSFIDALILDPDYLASCPDVSIQPKLTVVGVVSNPVQAGSLSTFTLAGNSYIVRSPSSLFIMLTCCRTVAIRPSPSRFVLIVTIIAGITSRCPPPETPCTSMAGYTVVNRQTQAYSSSTLVKSRTSQAVRILPTRLSRPPSRPLPIGLPNRNLRKELNVGVHRWKTKVKTAERAPAAPILRRHRVDDKLESFY